MLLLAPNGLEALALVMRYILEVNNHVEPEHLQALLERELGREAKDAIMTAGERLIEQGRIIDRVQRVVVIRDFAERHGLFEACVHCAFHGWIGQLPSARLRLARPRRHSLATTASRTFAW